MQKVNISFYDDLDWNELRTLVPADRTVVIALGAAEVELDLTEEHARALEDFLEPYMKAGRREDRPGVAQGQVRAGRATGRAMRAFADASADPKVYYTRGSSGSYYYSSELRDQFAATAAPAPAGPGVPAVS